MVIQSIYPYDVIQSMKSIRVQIHQGLEYPSSGISSRSYRWKQPLEYHLIGTLHDMYTYSIQYPCTRYSMYLCTGHCMYMQQYTIGTPHSMYTTVCSMYMVLGVQHGYSISLGVLDSCSSHDPWIPGISAYHDLMILRYIRGDEVLEESLCGVDTPYALDALLVYLVQIPIYTIHPWSTVCSGMHPTYMYTIHVVYSGCTMYSVCIVCIRNGITPSPAYVYIVYML